MPVRSTHESPATSQRELDPDVASTSLERRALGDAERAPAPDAPHRAEVLERRVLALSTELEELSAQYEDALEHIRSLESRHVEAEHHAHLLERTTVRTALLVEEWEAREEHQRELAESLAHTTAELREAHEQLAAANDALQRERERQDCALRRMGSELEAAGLLQRMLVAATCPRVSRLDVSLYYRSASESSGDFVGFLPNNATDELTILIGDVTGHGLGAALVAAGAFSSLATLEALAAVVRGADAEDQFAPGGTSSAVGRFIRSQLEPGALLRVLDRTVEHLGGDHWAMTFFAATFCPARRTVRFANAGHPFPILIGDADMATGRRAGARSLAAHGDQLGATARQRDAVRKEVDVQLSTNDLLLFYTDGLPETRSRRGRELGVGRIVRWLRELHGRPADDVRDELAARVEDYLDGAERTDDTTFVVARVTE